MAVNGRAIGIGATILGSATAWCWAVVAVGRAYASGWVVALIGAERPGHSPALAETLFLLLIFVPLVAIALVGGAVERRNAAAPGKRAGADLGFGLALGIGGLTVAVAFAWMAGVLQRGPGSAISAALLWGLVVVGFQTWAEEVFFRGWLQPALARRWGTGAAIVAAALAFALLHVAGGARAPLSLVNLLLGGLVFGLLAARTGGIAAAVGAHWGWNAAEQLGWGLDPNPGLGSFGALVDRDLVGSAWWGGSADGLNGSVGMTLALLAMLLPLVASGRRRALSPTAARG